MNRLQEPLLEGTYDISGRDWESCCRHVKKLQQRLVGDRRTNGSQGGAVNN
jgi:hypothetical protein